MLDNVHQHSQERVFAQPVRQPNAELVRFEDHNMPLECQSV